MAEPTDIVAELRAFRAKLKRVTPTTPDPGEKHIQYGIRLHWINGTTEDLPRDSLADAQRSVAMHAERRINQPGWKATAELIQRTVTVGPWTTSTEETPA